MDSRCLKDVFPGLKPSGFQKGKFCTELEDRATLHLLKYHDPPKLI